ncbi:MAG: hypothetical protein JWO45_1684 [Spartobacteria bacterium]|nr:hypothetical protein [Spartobacteria bacterium]
MVGVREVTPLPNLSDLRPRARSCTFEARTEHALRLVQTLTMRLRSRRAGLLLHQQMEIEAKPRYDLHLFEVRRRNRPAGSHSESPPTLLASANFSKGDRVLILSIAVKKSSHTLRS